MEKNNLTWDEYFMSMAYLVSMKSKDKSSRIGAVIVGNENELISTGFNGLPRGVKDDVPERDERPAKYLYYAHGERNSIYTAAKMGISTHGCKIYTQGMPCAGCAIAIIQSGIKEVIIDSRWTNMPNDIGNRAKWKSESDVSIEMFNEAGVKHRIYDGSLIGQIKGLYSGREIKL